MCIAKYAFLLLGDFLESCNHCEFAKRPAVTPGSRCTQLRNISHPVKLQLVLAFKEQL